jgi:hypothetical protein
LSGFAVAVITIAIGPSLLSEAVPETREEILAAMRALDDEMGPLFARRYALRDAYLRVSEPAALPSRRNRTETQERIARCPRCGGGLESEGADSLKSAPLPHSTSPSEVVTS